MKDYEQFVNDAVELLCRLIATPSVSRNERDAADILQQTISEDYGLDCRREANNIWITDPWFDEKRPTVLLNAHIDTVKPVSSWTRDPFAPTIEGDTLYGLGSNDCGGGLVSLLQTFDGIERVLPLLPPIDVAIVGEPTGLQPAIAEKGLMVLDIWAHGVSGHAARNEGVNAIYEALDDLLWLRSHRFERTSELLGPTLMNVTVIEAGTQHNVVPDTCHMVVDIRTNEYYQNEQVYEYICSHLRSEVKARSFRLHSSRIAPEQPLVSRCRAMGMQPFGSPTLSDQALMPFASFKLGPGESSRSHSADEFIRISEIRRAIDVYTELLDGAQL